MESFFEYLPGIAASVVVVGAAAATTLHAIFLKSDSRAAVGWIGLVWLSPIIGIVLYLLFGINRIRRQARTLRQNLPSYNQPDRSAIFPAERIADEFAKSEDLVNLALVGEANVERPLVGGNKLTVLRDGDEAYPAMLAAIDAAQNTVSMASYIFDNDTVGKEFAAALERAVGRGVEVRVLVDAAGARYSFPTIARELRKRGVPVARFLPSSLFPPYVLSINLRNHRKTLVVDGDIGFTGGMNIRDDCYLSRGPKFPTRDIHFKVEGPIVGQIQEIFAEDWTFTTGEELKGETWFPLLKPVGRVIARGIPDGPDEDIDKLRWSLLAAIGAARRSVRIVTPYFLPDESLMEALIVAQMRGVRVDVVMPKKNNLPYVAWAALGQMEPLLRHHVNIWFTEGPFDHSKVTVVDRAWVLLGSPNWDPRSLRLNFEFALECYSEVFASQIADYITERVARSEQWLLEDHQQRHVVQRVRDGVFRLAAPYL